MNEAQRKQLGIRLSTARTHAGLNHRQVADKLKLDRAQTVGDWEAGTYGITLDNLLALAELYNASLDWLVGRAETPKVGATGGLINLAVERTVLAARTYAEAESAARRLDAIVPAPPSRWPPPATRARACRRSATAPARAAAR